MARKKTEDKDQESEGTDEEQRDQALADLFKGANKNFGKGTMYSADDYKFKHTGRIPTGILPLDYCLGGGLPAGRVSMFYGHKSTSKTTNILRAVGNAQKMCSFCWGPDKCTCGKNRKCVVAWLDVEGVWDHDWASRFLTVDGNLLLSQPSSAEETIDLGHAALAATVDILVIDSIAFMAPQAEQDKSSSEITMGLQAKLMSQSMRKFVSKTNELGKTKGYRPTIILTNQIRQKIGVMFGNPDTISGGLAAGFATSVEIKTSAGKCEIDDATLKPIYVENKGKVVKNKTAPPNMEAEWKVAMSKTEMKNPGDIIDEGWAATMGERCGIISVAPQKVEWGGKTFRGVSLLEKFWMENREEYAKFKAELMPILLAA